MTLKNKVPPPLITLFFGGLIYYTSALLPSVTFGWQGLLALIILVVALGIIVMAVATFRQLQTTVNPLLPKSASALATSGIFSYSRNPMYLGMLLILIALSVYTGALASVLLLPSFVAYIWIMQIAPEEQAMSELFGDEFTDYCHRVRRWL
ncbi:MAG: methyltransferase family protein [Porticoccaceae bacterium]